MGSDGLQKRRKSILIVDDDKGITQLLEMVLGEDESIRVLTANNGFRALTSARKENPDLILLDVRLPEVNGVEVCKRLKKDRTTCGIKIIIMSGMIDAEEVAQEAEADGHLAKPFELSHLRKKLESWL